MVVRKRPPSSSGKESMINAVIQAGGSLSNTLNHPVKPYRLTLRIPVALKAQVDSKIAADPTEPSLTGWILEAIKQHLKNKN